MKPMGVLSEQQREAFWRDGWIVLEDAVTPQQLAALKSDMDAWIAESRGHSENYGETINGKPRFDLDPTHSADHPGLRRVNAPVEVSDAHYDVATNSAMVDAIADLVGPNVKFHHAKTNAKLPGTQTAVKFHQDFPFTPHSNDDIITALLMLDDVDENNGALETVAGSHKGPIHGLWHDGKFTGAVDAATAADAGAKAVRVMGKAGSACLMHTNLLHGSAPNGSDAPRTLFICVYSAEDAVPLSPSPMPNKFEGLVVRGRETGMIRSVPFELQRPQLPGGASFFEQQEKPTS